MAGQAQGPSCRGQTTGKVLLLLSITALLASAQPAGLDPQVRYERRERGAAGDRALT
jgi:hypothetical protein